MARLNSEELVLFGIYKPWFILPIAFRFVDAEWKVPIGNFCGKVDMYTNFVWQFAFLVGEDFLINALSY